MVPLHGRHHRPAAQRSVARSATCRTRNAPPPMYRHQCHCQSQPYLRHGSSVVVPPRQRRSSSTVDGALSHGSAGGRTSGSESDVMLTYLSLCSNKDSFQTKTQKVSVVHPCHKTATQKPINIKPLYIDWLRLFN